MFCKFYWAFLPEIGLYLESEHYAENCTETAEYDGVPLEFDLHPEDGEGGRGHPA